MVLKAALLEHLQRLSGMNGEELVEHRLEKFRVMGVFAEGGGS